MNKQLPFFSGTSPCKTCPYRKDAPLRLWNRIEFETLLEQDSEQFGKVYKCHQNNGSCCKGWLIDQDKRRLPNINLRMLLSKEGITRKYLDSLRGKNLYKSIKEMIQKNYPEINF